MLMPLNKIAEEIGVPESEAARLAIYFGVPRRSGLYEERKFLLAHSATCAKKSSVLPSWKMPRRKNRLKVCEP